MRGEMHILPYEDPLPPRRQLIRRSGLKRIRNSKPSIMPIRAQVRPMITPMNSFTAIGQNAVKASKPLHV